MTDPERHSDSDLAIVGRACRFPGAARVDEFWRNLCEGRESIRDLTDDELRRAGARPEDLAEASFVRRAALLDDFDAFDAPFFGMTPKDAAIMDPQHRVFLECAWEALENAGHVPERFDGSIGVFAGCGQNAYYMYNLLTRPDLVGDVGLFLLRHTGNDKDFLPTRVSYCMDLKGPSVSVQTACSTALVAVHTAGQSLLGGECDMALAGAVTIEIPQGRGYRYEEGELLSPDGRCRAFDAAAGGMMFGSGAGVVVLRRYADALADGDRIYGVIRGSAVNNDGAHKAGYLAPSVDGQARAVSEAIAVSDIDPGTIGFIEAHGTGTPIGDSIEVAALRQVFRELPRGSCFLGSVKTNIGHLDTAAGIASLIKATEAVRSGKVPPSLHFRTPNPDAGLEESAFVVNTETVSWSPASGPRRAGVNSFGVGGTNAHVIVEQPPEPPAAEPSREPQLLVVSARSEAALDRSLGALADHLAAHPDLSLADVAFTLQLGRRAFEHRAALVADGVEAAVEILVSGRCIRGRAGSSPEPDDGAGSGDLVATARAWCRGADVDFRALHEGRRTLRVELPTYPFERSRHFIEPGRVGRETADAGHPMLDRVVLDDATGRVYSAHYDATGRWFLAENRLEDGTSLMPAAGFLELARAAFEGTGDDRSLELRDLYFLSPFRVPESETRELRVQLRTVATGPAEFAVLGRAADGWHEHAGGTVGRPEEGPPAAVDLDALRRDLAKDSVAPAASGVGRWSSLRESWSGDGEALLVLELPEAHRTDPASFRLHPALVDLATAGARSLLPGPDADDRLHVPVSCARLRSFGRLAPRVYSHVKRRPAGAADVQGFVELDVSVLDASGGVLLEIEQFTLQRVERAKLLHAASDAATLATDLLWETADRPAVRAERATEVERALARHPAVTACVVLVKHDRPGTTRRVAYVVMDGERRATVSELRRFLRSELDDDETVPANLLELDELPLGPDGEPATDELEDPFAPQEDFTAPRTPMERAVAEVWAGLLGVSTIDVHDNFFDIGGHSLLAMRAANRLTRRTGGRLSQGSLVLQTLEQIAAELERDITPPPANEPAPEGSEPVSISQRLLRAVRRR